MEKQELVSALKLGSVVVAEMGKYLREVFDEKFADYHFTDMTEDQIEVYLEGVSCSCCPTEYRTVYVDVDHFYDWYENKEND